MDLLLGKGFPSEPLELAVYRGEDFVFITVIWESGEYVYTLGRSVGCKQED